MTGDGIFWNRSGSRGEMHPHAQPQCKVSIPSLTRNCLQAVIENLSEAQGFGPPHPVYVRLCWPQAFALFPTRKNLAVACT